MKRLAITAFIATAALAPAGAAEAAFHKQARFVGYISGKQVTKWSIEKHPTYRNCQGQTYMGGDGSETVRFKSEKPMRLLVQRYGTAAPSVKYGAWNQFSAGVPAITAQGNVERTGRVVYTLDPGECHDAGDPTSDDTGPYDCGDEPFDPRVYLNWQGSRLRVEAINRLVPEYRNCPLYSPSDVSDADFTTTSQRFPVNEAFDESKGLIVVRGHKVFTEKFPSVHGTARTTVSWELRLRRKGS